jgi:glycosyltransferase involved in cell wall biosynthesis
MKILFDHALPFCLAHGGFQTQIEQTRNGLMRVGVEVEWLRWWDDSVEGDIIHFFGRPSPAYIEFARAKRIKVVIAELLTGLGSRGTMARTLQTAAIRILRPSSFFDRMGWNSYRMADASVAITRWEAQLMSQVFAIPPERVHVIPYGVEQEFLHRPPAKRGPWLVCTATIAPRKRVVELAAAAVAARTPVWIVGRPYGGDDHYARELRTISDKHPDIVRHEGSINDRTELARVYAEARGFVLLSTMETLSLSSLEAAACGCPLLLGDLPWARTAFGPAANYCPIAGLNQTAKALRRFYDDAPGLRAPPQPLTWDEVCLQFRTLYESLLKSGAQ